MNSANTDFYVYVISRMDGEPCYIGKGRGKRWKHHSKFSHNKHLRNIYNQAGGTLPIVKLRENLTDAEACQTEIALIRAIGRKDLELGPLVNFTDGGEGLSGNTKSIETREKLRKAMTGRVFTEEWLKHMSLSRLGKRRSPESIEKQRKTITGRKRGPSPLRGIPNPGVRAAHLGKKNPSASEKLKGNKNSLGKNTGYMKNHPRKLTPEMVIEIRNRAAIGEAHRLIANDYGIHKSQITLIHRRKTWSWLS